MGPSDSQFRSGHDSLECPTVDRRAALQAHRFIDFVDFCGQLRMMEGQLNGVFRHKAYGAGGHVWLCLT